MLWSKNTKIVFGVFIYPCISVQCRWNDPCFWGSSIPVFFWILVNLVFLGLLTFAPKISTDVLFAPVMHRSWEEKSSDYDTTSHCLSAWMLYTLEQSQPQSDKHICNEHVIVKVKILNLHILKNTDILNCNR